MTMHTIFLVKDESESAGRAEAVLSSYLMGGVLATTLPLASAAVRGSARTLRIVAAVEVDPATGLDAYFSHSKAARRVSRELDLDQFISVRADGTVHQCRMKLPLIAKPERNGVAILPP